MAAPVKPPGCGDPCFGGSLPPMGLNEFQKEESLQQHRIETRMDDCDLSNPAACRALTEDAARLALERFFRYRFGSFAGNRCSIVYANMGPNNQMARDRLRRVLAAQGVAELAVAVWPPAGHKNAHYTFAVMIDDADAERWEDEARRAWSDENRETDKAGD